MTGVAAAETQKYTSMDSLLGDVASSQCRVFEQSVRRHDADSEATARKDTAEPNEQEFSFAGVTDVGDTALTVRVKVSAENSEGSVLVDLAVRYRWPTEISIPDNLVETFTQTIALPEAMAYVRMTFRDLARTATIKPIELPTQAFLPNSWVPST
ncbi:hypothetical protein [Rhodococcus qingshengii]|uniref:hypothetical protein n=1 Tax=Rhodococcus qingshengii TaxID=334542 RepID=UPI001AE07637|nr:hypothetical protein [Rhodococcus qingshengii]MCQ4148650.1 hypothetical protein [Rhodococcus qingshengii]